MSAPITLTGRLVADPEIKFGASGMPIASLRVVTSGRRKTDAGWEDTDTTFWSVTAFRQLAENVAESLVKGDQVIVTGKVKSREWQDNDGNKRTAFLAAYVFLKINGHHLAASEVEAVQMMVDLASGTIDEAAFADWLRANTAAR